MSAEYLALIRADGTTLCLSPLTDRQIQSCGEELTDVSGHFLYEHPTDRPDEINVIAQVHTSDGVQAIRHMLGLT